MSKTIAILLATYNGERWLSEQILSISAQSHPNWQLFVRDDASSDATVEVVANHAGAESRISLQQGKVRVGSAAGNFMAALSEIDLSAFDFVAFSDQDDIWAPGRLERAMKLMEESGAAAYSCDLLAFDNQARSARYLEKKARQQPLDYLFQGASAGCTYVLERKAAQLVAEKLSAHPQGMANEMSHDWLIYAICRSHGLRWLHDDSAQVFYRQHGRNVYGASQSWQGLKKKLAMVRSGWYRRQIVWNAHFLRGSTEELAVLSAVTRLSWRDRCWLCLRVFDYRRDRHDARVLAVLILLGWI